MKIKKFAAIDIGTNAVRLLFMNVLIKDNGKVDFKKQELYRLPIRLGSDVFKTGYISDGKKKRLMHAMAGFSHFIELNNVESYRICATSAMREAKNRNEVVAYVKKKTGLKIEIIPGKEEAEILYSTHISNLLQANKSYLYIDVGGGSTEITLFLGKQKIKSHSFNIGALRLLNHQVASSEIRYLKTWLNEVKDKYRQVTVIGSGGNINKLYKMALKTQGQLIYREELRDLHNHIKSFSVEERISKLSLNPDRADVIVPASAIYLKAMKWSGAHRIMVPKIGLADGIIRDMYARLSKK